MPYITMRVRRRPGDPEPRIKLPGACLYIILVVVALSEIALGFALGRSKFLFAVGGFLLLLPLAIYVINRPRR